MPAGATRSQATNMRGTMLGISPPYHQVQGSNLPWSAHASKREDRLCHRRPAVQTCRIRSEGPAIRSFVDADQLSVEPQPLGRKEIPFGTTAILMRVAKLPEDVGPAPIQHQGFGNDKMTRRPLEAVVVRGCEWQRPVGFEVVEPTHEVLRVDRKPVPLDAAVDRPHPVLR